MRTMGALLNIFDSILGFFSELSKIIEPEYILYGAVGVLFLVILISLLITSRTYEVKILKYVKNSNKYFKRHPHINEDNLVTVNNNFKRAPKNVRYAWQQYMLNRDKLPSDYMNTEICVDQPLKSSAHDNTTKVLHITTIIISLLAFLANLTFMLMQEKLGELAFDGSNYMNSVGWLYVFIIPILVYIIGAVVVIILKARHTAIVGDIYTEFHDFERYINKACSTLPSYIDYEVLFTRKEIRDGIPALQEYLEKRAMQEQKEKEEAEMNALNFDQFNFEELGLENALLMERAMIESTKFFNIKLKLTEKITTKQQEMASYQKNFDEVTKEFEKKAQAYRENLKQLNEQLNSTSVNIEANYIKKRYREDQQKLQQLEKDYEIASIRFNKQQNEINNDVKALEKEIAESKDLLERAMKEEGKSHANKVYGIINRRVAEQNKPIFDQQMQEMDAMKAEIDQLNATIQEKEGQVSDLNVEREKLQQEILVQKSEIEAIKNVREYLTSPEFRQVVIDRKKARKDSGIDTMSIEELRDRTATAEEQLKIANEKQAEMERQEAEMKKKLKRLEESEKQLLEANKAKNSVNKELEPINEKIVNTNVSLQQKEEDLMGKINKTLEKLDESKTDKEPAKKKNLNSLMANVSKLKSKKTTTKKDDNK